MDIVVGDVLEIEEPIFSGSYSSPKYTGKLLTIAKVIKDSYGQTRGWHTFTLEVITSELLDGDTLPRTQGEKFRKRGKNLYPQSRIIEHAHDKLERAEEKHERSRINKEDLALLDYNELGC